MCHPELFAPSFVLEKLGQLGQHTDVTRFVIPAESDDE
jgi:hypothetical protein